MPTLILPRATTAHPFAHWLVNKAYKAAVREGFTPRELRLPVPPIEHPAILSEAARLGMVCTQGRVPELSPTNALVAFLAGTGEATPRLLSLALPPEAKLTDWHAHTQFAYCGRGIDLFDAASLSLTLGVQVQGFSEHAFALYFPGDALKFYWQSDPNFVARCWAEKGRGRMVAYKAMVAQARQLFGTRVRFGLEVDLFGGGQFCLAPEDLEGWDMLIGAIHEVEGVNAATPQAEAEVAWMRDVERLLTYPIKILAHPFRYWPWGHRPVPRHLYKPVARMLAQAGVAAEINHHKNPFELDFFRDCLEEGVKISLGTDAHITRDIADLQPHLQTLDALGINTPELRAKHLLSAE